MSGVDDGWHTPRSRRRLLVPAIVCGALVLAIAPLLTWIALTSTGGKRGSVRHTASSSTTSTTTTTGAHSTAGATWTVYHGTPEGTGAARTSASFSSASVGWTSSPLDGQVYGEPLEAAGRVFVATENDTVYALAADSGAQLWSAHLGAPVPAGDLPCGDITPTVGVTGTPVIDLARSEIFVVADELVDGSPSHRLVGLDIYSGKILLNEAVDPPGADTAALLQRTGLNLDDGDVVFGMGGNFGDCGTYHGWLMSVPASGGTVARYEADAGAGERQGAVWMGGAAPEVTSTGDIWIAEGNGSVDTATSPYDGSDSVVELSSQLKVLQYFAPSDWYDDNAHDRDLGSTAPALLSNGTVVQVGKSQTAYLMRQSALGGIGGQLASTSVCTGADADGGDAVTGDVVFVPCQSGIEALETGASPPSVTVLWRAAGALHYPPIIAGGLVWAIGTGSLSGIDPSTGVTEVQLAVGSEANHFPTPSVGAGLLLAPGGDDGNEVIAFKGSSGLPGRPTPAPAGT